MSSVFKEVSVEEWEYSKATVGVYGKEEVSSILYAGKKPILVAKDDTARDITILLSYKGLEKNRKWDGKNKKWLDEWSGDWSHGVKVCDNLRVLRETAAKELGPLNAQLDQAKDDGKKDEAMLLAAQIRDIKKCKMLDKLLKIYDDLVVKVNKVLEFEEKKLTAHPVDYKWKTKIHPTTGKEIKTNEIDEEGAVYLKAKVGYKAVKGAPTFEEGGKEVPKYEFRYPGAKFVNTSKPEDENEVKFFSIDKTTGVETLNTPDVTISSSMKCVTKTLIGLSCSNSTGNRITRRLMQCYYKPEEMGGGVDKDLANKMYNNSIDEDDYYY